MHERAVALVTGASTGIGLAIAEELLAQGYFVVLTARKSSLARLNSKLNLIHCDHLWLRPLDVTDARERRARVDEIQARLGRLDYLINNAAVIYRTPLEYAYEFEARDQMLVNFHAPLELIKLCLPLMRLNRRGHILNVSSAAGFFSVPTLGLYSASKHALEGASEALAHELRAWNIHVTLVQPGFVTSGGEKTRFGLVLGARSPRANLTYSTQMRAVQGLTEQALSFTTSSPQQVAKHIERLMRMKSPPLRAQATLDAQVFCFLKRFLPDRLFLALISFCLSQIGARAEEVPPTRKLTWF